MQMFYYLDVFGCVGFSVCQQTRKLWIDFDEILRKYHKWNKEQVIRFSEWSRSPPESSNVFKGFFILERWGWLCHLNMLLKNNDHNDWQKEFAMALRSHFCNSNYRIELFIVIDSCHEIRVCFLPQCNKTIKYTYMKYKYML